VTAPASAEGDLPLPFLSGYPPHLLAQVRGLIARGQLAEHLHLRYPEHHTIRSDGALYDHAMALKQRFLRNAPPLAKVLYDNRLQIDQRALGTLTAVSRVQGAQLKAKREIRVAGVFRQAPAAMLDMIVVHELAHLKEREHDKAFYALCEHMLPGYHQVEFDTRLYLTLRAREAPAASAPKT
jgi:predicted metal-dependent hydrolase